MRQLRRDCFPALLANFLIVLALLGCQAEEQSKRVFSFWTLNRGEGKFTLKSDSLSPPGATISISGGYDEKSAQPEETRLVFPPDAGVNSAPATDLPCVIVVDGKASNSRASLEENVFTIDWPELPAKAPNSPAGYLSFEFPEFGVSFVFSLKGLAPACKALGHFKAESPLSENFFLLAVPALCCALAVGVYILLRERRPQASRKSAGPTTQDGADSSENANSAQRNASKKNEDPGQENEDPGKESKKGETHENARHSWREAWEYAEGKRGKQRRRAQGEKRDYGREDYQKQRKPESEAEAPGAELKKACEFFDLPENASFDEIRKKRTLLLKFFHPDRFENDPAARDQAELETKKVNAFYELLIKNRKGK